jgi:hypothetical protein
VGGVGVTQLVTTRAKVMMTMSERKGFFTFMIALNLLLVIFIVDIK